MLTAQQLWTLIAFLNGVMATLNIGATRRRRRAERSWSAQLELTRQDLASVQRMMMTLRSDSRDDEIDKG